MPLAARTIEPIYLCRRPLREGEDAEEVVQVAITQNAVLGALVQLASLVRHADDLFCDLADECQKVFEQTERIIYKVKRIKEGVGCLDSKKVPIPMGDLKQFSAVQDHHVAKHGFDCSLFTADNRPHCIKARYTVCDVTPVGALRGADMYRKDGLRSSDLFKLWPVVIKEHKINSPDLNENRKLGKAMTFNKRYKRLTPRPKTVHSISSLDLMPPTEHQTDPGNTSPTSSLSRSQPSILVAVDTSGAGFYRMSSFRQSLKGTASLDRKKKRRRTVSGVPDNIMHEIEAFERGKRNSRNTPRNYSFDDLDSRREPEKDRMLLQQFDDELDAKLEEQAEQVRVSREPRLLKLLPCGRSRSLPRCLKVGQTRGVMTFEEDKQPKGKDKDIATAASGYGSSCLSLGSTGGSVSSSSSSRATKRSSIIGNKIRSFVSGTLRPRPKSLDFDSIDVLGNDNDADAEDSASNDTLRSQASLKRTLSPSMPDDISSLSSSRESKVGPGTYYYFTSSTLPRAQARKYDFPWESLPKDWTTAVKLREISKRRKEERNSSSGNWSGSSNRQSLDSARSSTLPGSSSQHSLSRDSGRDSPFMGDDRDHSGHKTDGGGVTFSSFMPPTTRANTDSDTEQWLAALAKRAAAREDATGCDVTESLNRLSELTRQNIQALEDTFSPAMPLRLDDEVSSVYSLDQDGFYTSFHNDSGLKRSTGTLLNDDGDSGAGGGELTPVREMQTTQSLGSSNTIDSVIFRPNAESTATSSCDATAGREATSSKTAGGKVRPPPPVRSGSKLSTSSSQGGSEESAKNEMVAATLDSAEDPGSSTDPSASKDSLLLREDSSSPSESDQETVSARLKAKTRISPQAIPSWCSVSDDYSTDSSSVCLAGTSLQDHASVSLSGSAESDEGPTSTTLPAPPPSSATEPTESGGARVGEEEEGKSDTLWSCSTLPRRYLESKVWEEDLSDQCNSWPRSRRGQQNTAAVPVAGILKRDKSPAGSMKPKTLNFAPVVSMFDQHTPMGVELPLHASSTTTSPSTDNCNLVPGTPAHNDVLGSCISSDSLISSTGPDSGSSSKTYTLSDPLTSSRSQVVAKYQPSITVKPGPSIHSGGSGKSKPSQVVYPCPVVKPSSALPQNYAVTQLQSVKRREALASSDWSVSSSESSLPSLSDCGQGGYLNMTGRLLDAQSLDTLSSNSSAALTDMDSSLTYVTMSSQNSTPTNSTLALCPKSTPDPNLTPTNSPSRESDTYRISQVTLAGSNSSSGDDIVRNDQTFAGKVMAGPDSGPVLQSPLSASDPPSQNGSSGGRYLAVSDRQWLGSFSPNASTEAVPLSWLGDRLNGRTLSGDSGFSSPTTPTSVLEQQKQQHSHQNQPQHQPLHHRHNLPPSANRSSSTSNAQSSSRNHKGDVFFIGDSGHSLDRKLRTSDPPSQLSLGQKHDPLKAFPLASLNQQQQQQQQQKTPRSNSYRAATKALGQLTHQSVEQSGGDGSVRSKKRSQSSAQIFGSKPAVSHPHMPKSMSCPTGVLEDTDAAARADSYRLAVRNTQGVIGDMATRNTSYRMATRDEDPVPDSRMEAINNWESRGGSVGRDVRRMGITDIDQLKCYDSDSSSVSGKPPSASTTSVSGKPPSVKGLAGINSSRKKQKTEVQNLLQDDNSLSFEIKRQSKSSGGKGNADKSKRHSSSSTYIRFDPIFEQGDDMYSSTDTLRAESVEMIASEQGFLMSDKVVGRLPPGRVRGGGGMGRKSMDNNGVLSILGSIKTTFKSMSGKNASDKDMWKYDGGL